MLATRYDAPLSDTEWRTFLATQDFGQLIAVAPDDALPLVVPAHYLYDGDRGPAGALELHLHRDNPVWAVLESQEARNGTSRAVFAVLDAAVYIPTQWNAPPSTDPVWAAPTSYYAAVQAVGRVVIVDDPAELAAMLTRQLAQMQPEGGHGPIEPGSSPFGRMLKAIRGFRLEIEDVRAKFKFGGNKSSAHQRQIAEQLMWRGAPADFRARDHVLRRRAESHQR